MAKGIHLSEGKLVGPDGQVDVSALAGNGTSPVVLELIAYNPGTLLSAAATETVGDVDSTNLAATFTVPASGKVRVRMAAWSKSATLGVNLIWLLRTTANVEVTNSAVPVAGHDTGSVSGVADRNTYDNVFTGLTPGAELTWKWSQKASAAGNVNTDAGGGFGPAILEVVGLPA